MMSFSGRLGKEVLSGSIEIIWSILESYLDIGVFLSDYSEEEVCLQSYFDEEVFPWGYLVQRSF